MNGKIALKIFKRFITFRCSMGLITFSDLHGELLVGLVKVLLPSPGSIDQSYPT